MSVSAWNTQRQLRRSPIKTAPLRVPGQSVEERISELRDQFDALLMLPFCVLILAMFEWYRWWTALPLNPLLLTTVAIIAIVYAWIKGAPLVRTIRNLRMGRDGERMVGELLEPLREKGYRVFHDIPGSDFNVDHVIVGPAGIFVIETKTRSKAMRGSGKVFYNGNAIRIEDGQPFDEPLIQARAQARWLTSLLNDGRAMRFTVRPVVVFPEWYVEQIGPRNKNDVWVLNPRLLGNCLDRQPRVLSADSIDAAAHSLTQHCRRPST